MFAKAAEQDGEVISVKPEGIIVRYADGSEEGYPCGKVFGNSASLSFPFNIVSNVSKGEVFKAGDILTYNTEFFTKDTLARNTVVWKNAVQVNVALVEVPSTYEDASAITQRLASKLTSKISEPINITVRFNQAIHDLVKVGDKVKADDHLCVIEDEVTAGSDLFDQDSLDNLRILRSQTPRAKVDGVVDKIEVFYNGELEEMSESLAEVAMAADKRLAKELSSVGKKPMTGSTLGESYRIEGNVLQLDELVIRVHVTEDKGMGNGDKAVFANQLKTIISEVLPDPVQTESGVEVDALFGIKSVGNRIVNSPYDIGIDARLMTKATERAIAAYTTPIKG
ncbi:MAG: hypothetical protein M0R77_00595 [Gammaproteobacteria bacterium]|nr:hypothetical protein [Acholeplasmataceae bacterium]MCK9529052.1 hypothetical protein [Gammaproteobacteria bacterium]